MITQDGTHVLNTPSVIYADDSAIAGVDAGVLGFLTIREDGYDSDENGITRRNWIYKIFDPNHDQIGWGDDIRSPQWDTALEAMGALISFLLACAESRSEESENYSLFEKPVREWAEMVSDELTMISVEIDAELELKRERNG